MPATVGEGIRAKMAEMGDTPVTNEHNLPLLQTNLQRALGHKGWYYASNDSGQWVTVFVPFDGAE